ncbi:FHA domain-containing protein [Streptomyces benahoarensis]|uniref:FHA domain-containing protein n=1 Tax=Streptomyces benahoarensis TaxID=2595054 RepID=A0A553XTP7_9ACTN|nr:FHA domain-containing protein [Streptomyces benahoarensis]
MGHGVPELVLELKGRTWTLDPSRSYIVGRDPQGDMVLDDARVSWRHAVLRWAGHSWVIEDQGSTNGTYVQGQRIQQAEVGAGSAVHLGNATDGPRMTLSAAAAPATAPAAGAYGVPAAPQQAAAQGWQQPPAAQQPPVPQGQQPPAGAGQPYVPPQQAQQPPQQPSPRAGGC